VTQRFLSTIEVARLLGIKPGRLSAAIWDGRIAEPARGPGDSFLWTDEDVTRAASYFKIALPRPSEPATTQPSA
jgi:hypothetical protein